MEDPIVFPTPSQLLKPTPNPHNSKDDQPPPAAANKKKKLLSSSRRKSLSAGTVKAKVDADGVVKPKQTKSRTGCQACKDKRLKCDETKPTCDNCKKRSVQCPGYKTNFQFRDLTVSFQAGRRCGPQSNKKAKPLQKDANESSSSPPSDRVPVEIQSACSQEPQAHVTTGAPSDSLTPAEGDPESSGHHTASLSPPSTASAIRPGLSVAGTSSGLASPPMSTSGPLLYDVNLDTILGKYDIPSSTAALGGHNLDATWDPLRSSDNLLDPSLAAHDFDEEVISQADFTLSAQPHLYDLDDSIPGPTAALSPTSAVALIQNIQTSFLPQEPAFAYDSVENLTLHFDRLTCGILSVKDGATENPWRALLWPMAQESPSVFHSVCALAAFHGARHNPQLRIAGRAHNDLAIQNLHEGLRDDSIGRETRLAASLALGFADGWNHHTTSGNMHIKGARMMIRQALEEHQRSPLQGLRLSRLKFLCNTWVYMDVIARITSTDHDETDEYEQIYSSFGNPNIQHTGFGIDFGMGMDAQLDPLMGCASTLFPLVGRTANLARRVRRSNSNSPTIITQGLELKEQLEAWEPPDLIEPPEDETSKVAHALQTAKAYQWATLLYLHQTVPEIPSPTSSQLAEKVLALLATVSPQSRFLIVHIFPLMAAGCEAATQEDREWVRNRWGEMGRRLQIGSIDKCLEITEEVWGRRDAHASALPRRRSLVPSANPHGLVGLGRSSSKRPARAAAGELVALDINGGAAGLGLNEFHPDMDVNMTEGLFPIMMSRPSWPQVREWSDEMNAQYNVSGRLHWLSVMEQRGWEVLLG